MLSLGPPFFCLVVACCELLRCSRAGSLRRTSTLATCLSISIEVKTVERFLWRLDQASRAVVIFVHGAAVASHQVS